jgi:hypothetical protein
MLNSFFTGQTFSTLAGCVLAVIVVVNVCRHAFNWGPKWFALIVSVAASFIALTSGAVAAAEALSSPGDSTAAAAPADSTESQSKGPLQGKGGRYLIALLNGCLIYCTAFGVQNNVIVGSGSGGGFQGAGGGPSRLRYNSPW